MASEARVNGVIWPDWDKLGVSLFSPLGLKPGKSCTYCSSLPITKAVITAITDTNYTRQFAPIRGLIVIEGYTMPEQIDLSFTLQPDSTERCSNNLAKKQNTALVQNKDINNVIIW